MMRVLRQYPLKHCLALILGAMALIGGCNSSSSFLVNYSGIWDVRYNISQDECGVVTSGLPGFVDQHIIDQANPVTRALESASFDAQSGLLTDTAAEIDENDDLFAEEVTVGDIFGDGSTCTLTARTNSENCGRDASGNDRVDALFTFEIGCNDGFACRTEAVGAAVRQPEVGEIEVEE